CSRIVTFQACFEEAGTVNGSASTISGFGSFTAAARNAELTKCASTHAGPLVATGAGPSVGVTSCGVVGTGWVDQRTRNRCGCLEPWPSFSAGHPTIETICAAVIEVRIPFSKSLPLGSM